jgi:predicted  nucleic acid-binding Zn-ribbon protein
MAKDCLYCGRQYSDTTNFCPDCGRPTERGFRSRSTQESEIDRLRREMKEKDDLIRQLVLLLTRRYVEDEPERVTSTVEGRDHAEDTTNVYTGI